VGLPSEPTGGFFSIFQAMKEFFIPSNQVFARLIISAICISSAFSAAWLLREPSAAENTTSSQSIETISPTRILDQIDSSHVSGPIAKDLENAIQKTRQSPDHASHWILLGDLLAQIQRDTGEARYYDHAESVYLESLRLNAKSVDALAGMAWVTGGRHEFEKSIAWANQALAVDADCVAAFGILGDAALELGNYEEALDHYQKMMDLRPDLSSWSRGAHLLWIMGDKSKAQWLMTKAIRAGAPFAENTAWCRARLATMLFHDGALLPAQDAIQSLLDSKSDNVHVLLIAAKIAAAKQEFSTATDHYQAVLRSGSNQEALAGIGDILALQGQLDQAETYYQKVEALHATHISSGVHDHHFMAKFLADHDRNLIEALRMSEEHKLTKNVQELDTLAWVYYKNGQIPKAVEAMKMALRYHTPDAEIHFHAGLIASAHGDLTSACKHLDKSLQLNPNFSLIQIPVLHKALQELESRKSLSQLKTKENELSK
jgi:tetratricopeptide (TPR) repeat protein